MRIYLRLMLALPFIRLFMLNEEDCIAYQAAHAKYYDELDKLVQLHVSVMTALHEKDWSIGPEKTFSTYSIESITKKGWFRTSTTVVVRSDLQWICAVERDGMILTRSGSLYEIEIPGERATYTMIGLEGTGKNKSREITHFLQGILDEVNALD